MIKKKRILLLLLVSLLFSLQGRSEEFLLVNHDRVTGTVVREDQEVIVVDSEVLGRVTIKREFLLKESFGGDQKNNLKKEDLKEKEPTPWSGETSLGYQMSQGNTEKAQLKASFLAHRKTSRDEWTMKAQGFYASTQNKMDAKKYDMSTRYAFSFGQDLAWYHFYKIEIDHDRFSNIDMRIVPSTGIGYWFSDREDWKLMAELGAGYEHINYRETSRDTGEGIIVPRLFFERKLIGRSKISSDLSLFVPVTDLNDYRLRAEASFVNPIDDHWAIKMSIIDDYNNRAQGDIKKNDLQFISSLVHSF